MTNAGASQSTKTSEQELEEFLGVAANARPWYKRPYIWAAAIGLVALLLILSSLFGGSAEAGYATQAVQRQHLRVTVSATGNLEPTNQVEVGSEQSGLVDQVYVDNNDRVTKGQPLARLDPSRLRDTLLQAEAALAAAQAQVSQYQASATQAAANSARQEEVHRLSGGKVPAKTELESARAEAQRTRAVVRAGQAQVQQSRAQVSSARTNLSKATIYSPVTGVVLSRAIDPGQTVAASLQAPVLFTIAEDLAEMNLNVEVDEADVGQVKEGQAATFAVDAYPGRQFSARITRVDVGANASDADGASSTGDVVAYTAVLGVKNADLLLRPGMTATAEIVTSEKSNALVVPNAALRFTPAAGSGQQGSGVAGMLMPRPRRSGDGQREATIGRGSTQTVYVLGADGQPEARQVVVGDSNGSLTEILSGRLKVGEKIITGQLAEGQSSSGDSPTPPRQASLLLIPAILPPTPRGSREPVRQANG